MESERFDQLARRVSGQSSRRTALATLAALGLGGLAGRSGDAAPKRGRKKPKECSKSLPCPICQTCSKKHHKCKPAKDGTACAQGATCQSGACVCPSGMFACASANICCANGTACAGGPTCGACPAGDVCSSPVLCGQWGPDSSQDLCACTTSVGNQTTCSSGFGKCFACTSDAQCTTELGGPAVCLDLSGCPGDCDGSNGQPNTNGKACILVGCEDFSGGALTARAGKRRRQAIDMGRLLAGR